jgi:hypothetical protein
MSNDEILMLTNSKYFFLYSQTCLAGSFDNYNPWHGHLDEDSAAEHFTVEMSYGAFAVIMNARYGLGSENTLYAPSQEFDKSFFKALFTENIRELGKANHYSKEDHIWHIDENGIRWVYYQTNLLGDPEIAIKDAVSSPVQIDLKLTSPDDGAFYLFNIRLFKIPFLSTSIIVGPITVQAEATTTPENSLYSVHFYLDNTLQHVDSQPPYTWELAGQYIGAHTITAEAHGLHGELQSTSSSIFAIINS